MNWRKSSYSTYHGDCVEIALLPLLAAVRDSKNPGSTLTFPVEPWRAFLSQVD
nr:DUF397 domain-containing protein [Kibdelosporangium persicum]